MLNSKPKGRRGFVWADFDLVDGETSSICIYVEQLEETPEYSRCKITGVAGHPSITVKLARQFLGEWFRTDQVTWLDAGDHGVKKSILKQLR